MAGGSKKQKKKQRKRADDAVVVMAATDNLELLRDLPDLEHALFTGFDQKILQSATFNYYEKLKLHVIYTTAMTGRRDPSLVDLATLHSDMRWLLALAEALYSDEVTWNDKMSRVLVALHEASAAAGKYGPVWLECAADCELVEENGIYVLAGRALVEVVGQLEGEGLVVRRHGKFKPSRHRWPALEDELLFNDEDGEDSDSVDLEFEQPAVAGHHGGGGGLGDGGFGDGFGEESERTAAADALAASEARQAALRITPGTAASGGGVGEDGVDDELALMAGAIAGEAEAAAGEGETVEEEEEDPVEANEEVLRAQAASAAAAARGDFYAAAAADAEEYQARLATTAAVAAAAAATAGVRQAPPPPPVDNSYYDFWGLPAPPPPPGRAQLRSLTMLQQQQELREQQQQQQQQEPTPRPLPTLFDFMPAATRRSVMAPRPPTQSPAARSESAPVSFVQQAGNHFPPPDPATTAAAAAAALPAFRAPPPNSAIPPATAAPAAAAAALPTAAAPAAAPVAAAAQPMVGRRTSLQEIFAASAAAAAARAAAAAAPSPPPTAASPHTPAPPIAPGRPPGAMPTPPPAAPARAPTPAMQPRAVAPAAAAAPPAAAAAAPAAAAAAAPAAAQNVKGGSSEPKDWTPVFEDPSMQESRSLGACLRDLTPEMPGDRFINRAMLLHKATDTRVMLESIIDRHAGRHSIRLTFRDRVRADPELTPYQKLVASRMYQVLSTHMHHSPDAHSSFETLQLQVAQVISWREWLDVHLLHLVGSTGWTAPAAERLGQACSVVLRALAVNGGAASKPELQLQLMADIPSEHASVSRVLLERALQRLVGDMMVRVERGPRHDRVVPLLGPHVVARVDERTAECLRRQGVVRHIPHGRR